MFSALNALEENIIIFLQAHIQGGFLTFLQFMTNFGDVLLLVPVCGFLYWCYDKKTAMRMCQSLTVANVFYPVIKNSVKRVRPYMNNPEVICVKQAYEGDPNSIADQGYSFPSGHLVNCSCIYGTMFVRFKNIIVRVVTTLIVLLVALSRVVLGVHYPSDVIVGLIVGAVLCWAFAKASERMNKKILYLVLSILGGLGFLLFKTSDYYMGYGMMLGAFAAELFEEKYVKFENASNALEVICRMVGGILVFLIVYKGSKLPFSEAFLNSQNTLSFLVRAVRYFLITFVSMAIFPMCFRFRPFGSKKK